MIWSEHTEILLEELHYRGIFNKQRPNRNIIDSKQKQHILPLDVLYVIKSFMGCNY